MMDEAKIEKCNIEAKYHNRIYGCFDNTIELIPYEREDMSAQLLPKDVYDKFKENNSQEDTIVVYSLGTTGKSKGIFYHICY